MLMDNSDITLLLNMWSTSYHRNYCMKTSKYKAKSHSGEETGSQIENIV